jgi:Predicted amidophosphoribosyltransferases
MSVSFVILLIMILFTLLVTAVPVVMGIFVYRDAKARGMDALLWTLIAVFAPGFIGLIIYLIMRREHLKLSCPNCGNEVKQTFVSCPNCGQKLAASCGNCGAALSPEWKLCPQCGAEITGTAEFAPPVVTKPDNKGFLIAIIAIMAVPLALIIIAVSLFAYSGMTMYAENDSEAFLDFVTEMGMEPVCVTSSDACDLPDSQLEWIKDKQAGEKGIYATTFSSPAWGEMERDEFTGTYSIVYDYTMIVVNTGNAKALTVSEFDYDTVDSYISSEVNITLVDAAADDEEAAQYGNVFVVKTISGYTLDYKYKDGRAPEKQEKTRDESDSFITVTIENAGRYKVPVVYGQEKYIPFQ